MSAVEAACHCGAVRLTLAAAPDVVTECNCSICRRYGVIWAYYAPGDVTFVPAEPATEVYQWGDRALALHRCRTCGCVTHWWPGPQLDQNRIGINARLLEPDVLAAARLRHLDRAVTETYLD